MISGKSKKNNGIVFRGTRFEDRRAINSNTELHAEMRNENLWECVKRNER
jgi:hypothetical protein